MVDVIIPGYSHNAYASARLLKEALERRGKEVDVLDIFKDVREKSWWFRRTLLTIHDHTIAVKTAEAEIRKIKKWKIGTVYTHSYGVTAILAENLEAERYVLIAPPLETVQWKKIEKLFWFLPGFKELRDGTFQEAILKKMESSIARRIVLIISSRDGNLFGDERVGYTAKTINRVACTPIKLNIFPKVGHGQFMRDPKMVERIIKEA